MKSVVLIILSVLICLGYALPSVVLADYVVDGRTCPDNKPVNLPSGCYTNEEYINLFQGGLVAICVFNTPNTIRYRSNVPNGYYFKVKVARQTGSSGYVGLISNGGIELENLEDDCPAPYFNETSNGYNNGYNNNYNNGYIAPFGNNGYNNGYNNGFNNGYNNGYNNGFNNGFNNGYNNGFQQ